MRPDALFKLIFYVKRFAGLFVHPRVACFIADEKDQSAAVTGMFSASSKTRRPCNMCLLDFQSESLTLTGQPRSLKQMRQVSVFNSRVPWFVSYCVNHLIVGE